MIGKPKNYETLKGGWENITPGGHLCVVKEVKETTSDWDSSKQVVLISFDTSNEDAQPQYYTNAYLSDKRADKKWRGTKSYTVDSEYFDGQISKFVGALEASNPGVDFWKNDVLDLNACKNKKVGIVFRGEDYTKQDGTIGYAVKPFYFCSYDKSLDQDVPERKEAAPSTSFQPVTADQSVYDGFVDVPADGLAEEGLPFN